jgi:hypothetical protein
MQLTGICFCVPPCTQRCAGDYHLVVETPNANLVDGMKWLLSAYTIRLNHRHKRFGHVFSGRYKALLVEKAGLGDSAAQGNHADR